MQPDERSEEGDTPGVSAAPPDIRRGCGWSESGRLKFFYCFFLVSKNLVSLKQIMLWLME